LASLEDPPIPSAENILNRAVDSLVHDNELATEIGIDDHMKNGLLRSLSQASRQDSISSRSFIDETEESESQENGEELVEEEEEIDEIEEEMATDVAKTWGQFTKAINNVLCENLGDDIANKASQVLAPVTIEFCSILSKCTMVCLSVYCSLSVLCSLDP
jgi:hypothetical protein